MIYIDLSGIIIIPAKLLQWTLFILKLESLPPMFPLIKTEGIVGKKKHKCKKKRKADQCPAETEEDVKPNRDK